MTGEKVTGNGLPAYETSSHGERRGSAIGPEVLAGDVFEGHTQSTQRVGLTCPVTAQPC